ncbi:winged helix-turn-helix transcriptional regulator [Candidatus Dojkabacteria bacterium]|nr:winged helix-turn-helix transcriptional regulator [Candidatus Dojkabacteria bacterium]
MTTEVRIKTIKAVLEPKRIKILTYLYKSESCVCEMVRELKIRHNLLSHHLSTLTELGVLENRKKGRHSIYRIKDGKRKCISTILDLLNNKSADCN